MSQQYKVRVRPCLDERNRYRYTLFSQAGVAHIGSLLSFGSPEMARRMGEFQVRKLAELASTRR